MTTKPASEPTPGGEVPKGKSRPGRWRRRAVVGLVCLVVAGGVLWLAQRLGRPEDLVYTPAGGMAEAQALVARLLATNRPWLEPEPRRATYSFRRTLNEWSPGRAWNEKSLRHLRTREAETLGPFSARWKSGDNERIGVLLETPLPALLDTNSSYSLQMVGQTTWQRRRVLAVDVTFQRPVGGRVGMGVGSTHYSSAGFETRAVRILIDPVKAVPLFVGTSDKGGFSNSPRFWSKFVFRPDYLELPGGLAPRLVEWRRPDISWRSRYEFQVTNGFWFLSHGRSVIGPSRTVFNGWSRLEQRLEVTSLEVGPIRPGDLQQEYPTRLTAGDSSLERARAWQFGPEDIFHVSGFKLAVGQELQLELGPADLGIGYCSEGALWAILIPRAGGSLTSRSAAKSEQLAHVWLRFHPKEIGRLFPQETLSADGSEALRAKMCAIANIKMLSGHAADGRATIPNPGEVRVDVDTQEGPRRVFEVDTSGGQARYVAEFESRALNLSPEAIDSMSQPLPDHRQEIAQQNRDRTRPRVVSVHPAPGATGVATTTELRLRFDRPMEPLGLGLTWESGEFRPGDFARYDSNTLEFVLPVKLRPGVLHQIAVNKDEPMLGMGGFVGTNGKPAALYAWRFITENGPAWSNAPPGGPSAAQGTAAAPAGVTDPKLLSLLQRMQQQRATLTALVEQVQTVSLSGGRKYNASGATFKWQPPNQCYGDVSQIMGGRFRLGCDGQTWWWETGSVDAPGLALCPTNGMQVVNLSLADPFGLSTDSPGTAVTNLGLVYVGTTNRAGTDFYVVEAKPSGSRWWIHAQAYRVALVAQGDYQLRFFYEAVNGRLASAGFAPPKFPGIKIEGPERLDADYTQRFVNLADGADGRMSVRWGKMGPKARSSSGLN